MILLVTMKYPPTETTTSVRVFVPKGPSEQGHLSEIWAVLSPWVIANWSVVLGYETNQSEQSPEPAIAISQLSSQLYINTG